VAAGAPAVPTANLLTNDVRRARKAGEVDEVPFDGAGLAALVALGEDGTLSSKGVRQALAGMLAGEGSAAEVVEARGLAALTDPARIGALVDEVMAANPDKVETYRGGKTGLKGFFVGQVMKASGGRADPGVVQQVLGEKLG
jgi:Asp-tRNA(Asn)/Glu-tRNA(Gln) amidotransferase B subunit